MKFFSRNFPHLFTGIDSCIATGLYQGVFVCVCVCVCVLWTEKFLSLEHFYTCVKLQKLVSQNISYSK